MKLSAIMVKPQLPLRMLQPSELEVFSRILFQYFVGLDEKHTKRWRRMWGRVFKQDNFLQVYPVVERHGEFHKMHMALENELFEHQDGFWSLNGFRVWLKTGAGFGHYEASNGQLVFVPTSLSYDDCSDDEMREFHDDALAFLRTPLALKTLWPAMNSVDRMVTLELLIAGEDGEVPPPERPEAVTPQEKIHDRQQRNRRAGNRANQQRQARDA